MIISVASGKGGTGKTTVAASLAYLIPESTYLDCDVEEPNGHLLLRPEYSSEENAEKLYPEIDIVKCNLCGKCIESCEFNALINLKCEIILFEEMCHSCGACKYFCPLNIIVERAKEIGKVRIGKTAGQTGFVDGVLNVGEISAVPLIRNVKSKTDSQRINIIDSPPGTSCSMMEAVKDSDFCILVTESTPFGLNDLKLAVGVLKTMRMPFGIVINKYDSSFKELEVYLRHEKIDILLKIPFERRFAESYSRGMLPVEEYPELREDFLKILELIEVKLGKRGKRSNNG